MRYAINRAGNVAFETGDTPFPTGSIWPIPDAFISADVSTLKIVAGELVLKTAEELRVQNLPAKYRTDGGYDKDGNQLWIEKSEQEKASADVYEAVPAKYRKQVDGYWVKLTAEEKAAVDAAEEQAWQDAKSPALKALENIYVDFLTNMWTPALRTAGVIAPDYTVTVSNTDEPTNMYFLIQLRSIDYATYDKMANEFLRLKTAIVGNDGIMAKVIQHT